MPNPIITDGTLDFSGGVDSVKVTTVRGERNQTGLSRNQLAWLINGTVRDGGISQRLGWKRLGRIHDGSGFYQGGWMYDPINNYPYLVVSIGGEIFRVDVDFVIPPINLSGGFGIANPAGPLHGNFCQGNQYLVIQAGDNVTLPLFWDDVTLRRSIGITNTAVPPGTPGVNELPAGTAMDYYQNRFWYAEGRRYSAGDIIGGRSGTVGNFYRDAILNVTENPLVLGGDGFSVPTNAGNVRALFHNANINAALGEGQLFIGTRKAIYAQQVPLSRNDWISTTANIQPKQTVVQLINGPVNDRSVVKVNGDIFYQTLTPAVQALSAAVRNFGQWGNSQVSANELRALNFVDRSLLIGSTGIEWDNRLLMSTLPRLTAQGIVHQGLLPLDFVPISSFGASFMPVWEGMLEGLDILQLFTGDFGGRERAFAVAVNRTDSGIDLWELTSGEHEDYNLSGDARVTRVIEFPAFTWQQEFLLKKLVSAELWIDKLSGTVEFTMEYRPDSDACWRMWHAWKECSAKNSCEDVRNPICYPITPYCESFRATITLPKPQDDCVLATGRPANVGYQFQCRLTIKGWCRIRGLLLHAETVDKALYTGIRC